jgi:hypothetical protein
MLNEYCGHSNPALMLDLQLAWSEYQAHKGRAQQFSLQLPAALWGGFPVSG